MKEANIALARLPQDTSGKLRPILILRQMPRFNDWLVCAISTQLHQQIPGFDSIIKISDKDFSSTGLIADSVIRISNIAVLPSYMIAGNIGTLSPDLHQELLTRLANFLVQENR